MSERDAAAPAGPRGPVLRVLTMNVLGPGNPDWARRRALLARTLRDLAPDVVALQEVPVGTEPGYVDDVLGPGFTPTPHSRTSPDGVGAVLATRSPHEVVEELDLRRPPLEDALPWCATVVVRLRTAVGTVVVAHHKPSWPFPAEAERLAQAVDAARALERVTASSEHVVVLGDFDATPDAASMRFWRGREPVDGLSVCYQDAWETVRPGEPGSTFCAENPLVRAGEVATAVSRRIDHVLVRAGRHGPTLQVVRCERVLDRAVDGVWASDHYGVVADLAVPDHPPGSWAAGAP